MKTLRTILFLVLGGLAVVSLIIGCDLSGATDGTDDGTTETGTISLSLTDAPIVDAADVEGVFITIESIAYNLDALNAGSDDGTDEESDDETEDESDGGWITAEGFEGPMVFNLLELTGGNVAPLVDTEIAAGTVTQIRFMLSATEQGEQTSGTSGCYIVIDPDGIADGVDDADIVEPLFVPSGSQTGYKANGPFDIPANGTVEITADFDVRQSVVYAGNPAMGNGFYLLKPTISLIVNDQAGHISGDFTDDTTDGYDAYVVFAYEDDIYTDTEATAADDQSAPFPNAATSGNAVDTDGDVALDTYTLAFLSAGTYDLIVAGVDADGNYTVVSDTDFADVVVTSEETTDTPIDLTALSASTE